MTDTEKILAKIDEQIKPLEEKLNILEQLVPIGYTPEDIATKPCTKDFREVKSELSFLYALSRQVGKHYEVEVWGEAMAPAISCVCGKYDCAFIEEVETDLGIEKSK